jgi:glycosyltransferase involved in cell wall biosynthesis
MKEEPFDVVLTSSPPPSVHRVGLALSPYIPWIADFRDPWHAIDNDYGPTFLHRLINRGTHKRILRNADAVITATPELAQRFKELGPSLHIEAIRNGYDEADYDWESPAPWTADKLTMALPGTFSRFSDPLPAFRAIAAWRSQNPDLPLHVCHVGATMDIDVQSRLAATGLNDVYEDIGYVNHKRAVAELAFADLLLVAFDDRHITSVSVPGRIYEMLRSQRPIVAFTSEDGALASLLKPHVGCAVVSSNSMSDTSRVIDNVLASPIRSIDSVRAFDRRTQALRLSDLCQEAIQSFGGPA